MFAHLKYISQSQQQNLNAAYRLLPGILKEGSKLTTTLLGMKIDATELLQALSQQDLTPAFSSSSDVLRFNKSSSVLWLPAPLLKRLPSMLLATWMGKDIFPSHLLGDLAWSPLWLAAIPPLKAAYVISRKSSFSIPSSYPLQETALNIISAIGESLHTVPPAELSTTDPVLFTAATSTTSIFCGEQVPFTDWPVFLSEAGNTLKTAKEISWPYVCFAGLPEEIRSLLRPMMVSFSLSRLQDVVETEFLAAVSRQGKDDPILLCYNAAIAAVPGNFFTVEKCTKLLFEKVEDQKK